MTRRIVGPVLAMLFTVLAGVSLLPAEPTTVEDRRADTLGWLSGCWTQSTTRSVVEEMWMRPGGGTLLGVSRTVRRGTPRDSTTEYESVFVFERNGKLVYGVTPSRQAYTEFVESELTDSSVVFSNAAHDFPQNVRYQRLGRDSLLARVDGTIQGRSRGVDFRYARTACS